jgi:hypothetical protein
LANQDRVERQKYAIELQMILSSSEKRGLTLRVIGSLAFQFHNQEYGTLQETICRSSYPDIDFTAYRRDVKAPMSLMSEPSYQENREVFIVSGGDKPILTKDWGLWGTTTMNLEKIKLIAQDYEQLDGEQKDIIDGNIDDMLSRIQQGPKSLAWRIRMKISDRIQWYKDVDEV